MKKKTSILILCILSISIILLNLPLNTALEISSTKTGRVIRTIALKENDFFVLSFVHSVNKRPVDEYIKIDNNQLVVFKARYDSFGAGMPETSVDGLNLQMKENSILELTNINRRLDEFSIFVGRVAQHSIQINGQKIPLTDLGSPGESLTFKPIKASYLDLWKGR